MPAASSSAADTSRHSTVRAVGEGWSWESGRTIAEIVGMNGTGGMEATESGKIVVKIVEAETTLYTMITTMADRTRSKYHRDGPKSPISFCMVATSINGSDCLKDSIFSHYQLYSFHSFNDSYHEIWPPTCFFDHSIETVIQNYHF